MEYEIPKGKEGYLKKIKLKQGLFSANIDLEFYPEEEKQNKKSKK